MTRALPALLAAVLLAALAALPAWLEDYGLSLMISVLSYVVLATAWAQFSGTTRYVSLATAAFFGTGVYLVAVLAETLPMPAILLIAAVVGGVLAVLVGLSTLRLSGMHFVIFTFGLSELIRQLVIWWEINQTKTLGRYVFTDFDQGDVYYALLALCVAVYAAGWAIGRSRLGFALKVIGEDETVARHVGIDTTAAKIAIFAFSAVFMTLAGAVMAPRWTYIDPNIAFNPLVSFQVLIMALLGGAHRLWGPALGAVPLVLLFEVLSAEFPHHFSIVLGAVFLAIVYFLPRGAAGLVENGLGRLRRRPAPAESGRLAEDLP